MALPSFADRLDSSFSGHFQAMSSAMGITTTEQANEYRQSMRPTAPPMLEKQAPMSAPTPARIPIRRSRCLPVNNWLMMADAIGKIKPWPTPKMTREINSTAIPSKNTGSKLPTSEKQHAKTTIFLMVYRLVRPPLTKAIITIISDGMVVNNLMVVNETSGYSALINEITGDTKLPR